MILLYNTNATHNPNAYLTLAVEDALRRLAGAQGVMRVDERTLAPVAATGAHELLICIDGQRLNAGLIARVRPAFRKVVLWVFEDPFMLEYNLAHLDLFDLVFTNDPSCVLAYRGRGHFLPLAGSRLLQYRDVLPDPRLRYDIFFAGTMWPNRVPVLRQVIAAFPNASMKLVCPTNAYLPPLPPQIAMRAITRPISHEAFIDFANASRVTLTLFRDYASHTSSRGGSGLATAPGPRLFELGLAGTAQVVHRHDRMPERHFAGMDGIVLERGDALMGRIAEILADNALRESLARRAQASVLATHRYEHRLERLLELATGGAAEVAGPGPIVRPHKLRVLMCTHSTIHNQFWGGVEVYQRMLCTLLARDIEAFTWIRRDGSCQLLDVQERTLEQFDCEDIGWLDVLSDSFEETHFSSVLAAYAIDVVHFQHLGHHAASLPLIAKASGVGTVFSVHDFFLVCARYNLLDHQQNFCDIGTRSISACTICLGAAESLPAGVQQQRRGFMEQVLTAVDLLLFGSRQSEALVMQIYPQTKATRRLVLGIPAPAASLPPARRDGLRDAGSDVLDVVVIGNFLRIKGADTVLKVIETARPDLFHFHIMGMAEPPYLAALEALKDRHVSYHGRHTPGDLSLSHGQVALHLSIWPETWCISLSEAWQAGLIPIVTDIGALGERVTHGIDGFKVRVDDAGAVLDLLEILRVNPGLREKLRARIGPHLWPDAGEYAARILTEYHALAPRTRLGAGSVGRMLGLDLAQLHLLPKRSWKELANSRHILDASAGTGLRLDLPQDITEWVSIQQCRVYVDQVCGQETDPLLQEQPGERVVVPRFQPADRFTIQGWVFQPGASQARQVFVCLIHRSGRHVVFLDGERRSRADVHASFPDAPLRSGYMAEVRLAGKWADGEYGIGVIVVTNGRAAFNLSKHQMSFADGRVVELATALVDHAAILHAFACVFSTSTLAEHFAGGSTMASKPAVVLKDDALRRGRRANQPKASAARGRVPDHA